MFPNLNGTSASAKRSAKRSLSFVSVLQTSDILGTPDERFGNLNVQSNGGRLQPGCFRNENNISECKILTKHCYKHEFPD